MTMNSNIQTITDPLNIDWHMFSAVSAHTQYLRRVVTHGLFRLGFPLPLLPSS